MTKTPHTYQSLTELVENAPEAFIAAIKANPNLLQLANNKGYTVAHSAAYYGHLDQIHQAGLLTTDLLMLADKDGWTVAHSAARNGHLDQIHQAGLLTTEILLLADWEGRTVAHSAANNGHLDQIADVIVEAAKQGINILRRKDKEGKTVRQRAGRGEKAEEILAEIDRRIAAAKRAKTAKKASPAKRSLGTQGHARGGISSCVIVNSFGTDDTIAIE